MCVEDSADTLHRLCEPVYSLSEGLTQPKVASLVAQSLAKLPDLPEWIEPSQLADKDWPGLARCVAIAHRGEHDARATGWLMTNCSPIAGADAGPGGQSRAQGAAVAR